MPEKTKLGKYDATIFDKDVIVFHNTTENPQSIIDYYEERPELWEGWYGFGRQISRSGSTSKYPLENFPTEEQWEADFMSDDPNYDDNDMHNLVGRIFYHTSAEYFKYNNNTLPNWTTQSWGIARYIEDKDFINDENLSMTYHQDFVERDLELPGRKFGYTAVFYPNDDYEGGEISIRKVNSETKEAEIEIDYKPQAGDIVFFPSRRPWYHGVKRIYNNPKYIYRFYWCFDEYEGTKTYQELKAKYGDKFEELETIRMKDQHTMHADPWQRARVNLKEYYDLYEQGYVVDRKLSRVNLDELEERGLIIGYPNGQLPEGYE